MCIGLGLSVLFDVNCVIVGIVLVMPFSFYGNGCCNLLLYESGVYCHIARLSTSLFTCLSVSGMENIAIFSKISDIFDIRGAVKKF